MTQQTTTFLLRGGLDLVTPPVALKPGTAIAAVNYEPDVAGYTRMTGYERFDGRTSPSLGVSEANIAALRAQISEVPGTSYVLGVAIFDGSVYAWRNKGDGTVGMYKSRPGGWELQTFNDVLYFEAGTAEFVEGEVLAGGTSGATATIVRLVIQSGSFSGGDAVGYFVLGKDLSGAFQEAETVTSDSGSATSTGQQSTSLSAGFFPYSTFVHNFYGPGTSPRLYFCNGLHPAMEWDGVNLAPIRTGVSSGTTDFFETVRLRSTATVTDRGGDIITLRVDYDIPRFCAPFANHLFLGFANGGVVFSGPGAPLDFRTISGAGSFGFPAAITGFLQAAQTAFIIFGRDRIEYLTGTDVDTFTRHELNATSGAYENTAQLLDQPFYLDDGGLRSMSTTDAFGDWRLGTVTRQIEPLMRTKREANTRAAASVAVKGRDQYRMFWRDGTGITVYFGRKNPEVMPFKLPVIAFCATVGEVSGADGGERIFIGAQDGYVYEMDKGTSFDGESIPAYVRFVWNTLGAPAQYKKFGRAALEIDAPEDVTLGFAYHVDFSRRSDGAGAQVNHSVSAGSRSDWAIDDYDNIDWTIADQGQLETWVDTIGRNLAISIISDSATEDAHTLSSMTLNYSPRRAER